MPLDQQKLFVKKMIATFFRKSGYNIYPDFPGFLAIATISLDNHITVNAPWYYTICLEKIVAELRKKNKKNSKHCFNLHQVYRSSHTVLLTMDYLKCEKLN